MLLKIDNNFKKEILSILHNEPTLENVLIITTKFNSHWEWLIENIIEIPINHFFISILIRKLYNVDFESVNKTKYNYKIKNNNYNWIYYAIFNNINYDLESAWNQYDKWSDSYKHHLDEITDNFNFIDIYNAYDYKKLIYEMT